MNENILVVEDDLFLRDGLSEMLHKEGYSVKSADNCLTAKEELKKEQITKKRET